MFPFGIEEGVLVADPNGCEKEIIELIKFQVKHILNLTQEDLIIEVNDFHLVALVISQAILIGIVGEMDVAVIQSEQIFQGVLVLLLIHG